MIDRWHRIQARWVEVLTPPGLAHPKSVPLDAPWNWLAAGWRDIWANPKLSLGYGMMFAIGALVLAVGFASMEAHALFIALAGGFLLIGPFVAVGLYEASRRLATGENVTFRDMLAAARTAPGQLSFFGMLLLLIALIWIRIAFLLMMLFLGTTIVPPPDAFMQLLLFTPLGLGLLIVGTVVGGLLATLVFAISAVAVPLLMVSRLDAVSAARASLAAVVANPAVMALWAILIVVIMAAGFATLLGGLVIAFPLIGHATWHAQQDIYSTARESVAPMPTRDEERAPSA